MRWCLKINYKGIRVSEVELLPCIHKAMVQFPSLSTPQPQTLQTTKPVDMDSILYPSKKYGRILYYVMVYGDLCFHFPQLFVSFQVSKRRDQRTTCGSLLSPSNTWVLAIKFRLSGWVVSTLTHWDMSWILSAIAHTKEKRGGGVVVNLDWQHGCIENYLGDL